MTRRPFGSGIYVEDTEFGLPVTAVTYPCTSNKPKCRQERSVS